MDGEQATVRFFEGVPLFRDMRTAELEDVARMVRPFELGEGEAIFRQGDASDGMYILGRGAVEIRARVPGDETMTLARLSAGDVLGELSLLDRGARSATAVAVEPTTGYWLGRRQFELLRHDMRPASLTLMRRLVLQSCALARRSCERITALLGSLEATRASASETAPAVEPASGASLPLDCLPLLSRLTTDERARTLDAGDVIRAPRGAQLHAQGDEPREVHLVLRGAVRTLLDQSGRPFGVAVHGPGCLVGLVGGLDAEPHATSAIAAEESLLLRLPRAALHALLAEPVPRAFHLSERLHEDLVQLLRRCTDHASRLELERQLRAGQKEARHV